MWTKLEKQVNEFSEKQKTKTPNTMRRGPDLLAMLIKYGTPASAKKSLLADFKNAQEDCDSPLKYKQSKVIDTFNTPTKAVTSSETSVTEHIENRLDMLNDLEAFLMNDINKNKS